MNVFGSFTDEVAAAINAGQVGVLPTDTIYGVVAKAANVQAVERLYALKHREHKPGTIIAANTAQLCELGLKNRYLKAVADYWPGALSAVIPCGSELEYLHQCVLSLAVRIPDEVELNELLRQTGPLLTSSANHPGQPPANTAEEAQRYFGGTVDYYVDGGDLSGHAPSTVIRVVDDAIEVLRTGAVHINDSGRII